MIDQRMQLLRASFASFFRFAPRRLSINFLLMLLQSLTSGIGLLFILPLLQLVGLGADGASPSGPARFLGQLLTTLHIPITIPALLVFYVVIVSVIAVIRFFQSVLSTEIQQGYTVSLRHRLLLGILHSRWQFILQRRTAQFIHTLTGQVQSMGFIAQQTLQLINQLFLLSMYTVLAFILSWSMTLVAIAFALSFLALLRPLHQWLLRSGRSQLGGYKEIFQMISEQLACLKMIKSHASEDLYADKMLTVSRDLEQQQLTMTRITSLTQLVYMIGSVLIFSLLFYLAVARLKMELAPLVLLLFVFARLLPQVASAQRTYQQILHKLPAFNDVEDLLSACHGAREEGRSDLEIPFTSEIRLENISYWYQAGRPVIEKLYGVIGHNQIVAIEGPSGAGKTTLADLIAGLLVPGEGSIYCDGVELTPSQLSTWRAGIAYVTQEVFLFHDTVRNNLSWIRPGVTEEEMWQALENAAARDFVENLPKKLDSMIGDRGIRLSGGERQRLVLARALLIQPKLLILDEATSALDKENEARIQEALLRLKGKLTVIVISHGRAFSSVAHHRIILASPLVNNPTEKKMAQAEESI